jgi:hypothetical protein
MRLRTKLIYLQAMLLVISMYQLAQLSPGTMIEALRNLIAKCVKEGRLDCLFPAEWSDVVKSFGVSPLVPSRHFL